ncbi:GNAT family N-acetyltransferase [Flavobacterium difficile]|uniref:GNAT family N-acetyltransferase n=1 Tax=Flavobacterium difficile TaxID=2709659 RepID=A0ABX0I049_9FLAO|nr:GNAT family N-acetyltransferase [Flavobacterium difficile]NHM00570.1 GNAT family N-acetyltransferase [Flavobacterium difficile]
MEIHTLTQKTEMLAQFPIIKELYPDYTLEKYSTLLDEIVKGNYSQIIVTENNETIALTGVWIGTKLWCDKYVEIDNFIVAAAYRGKKIGNLLINEVNKIAKTVGATQICLDAYTNNFTAGKFYINQGFVPKGFHFVKFLNP